MVSFASSAMKNFVLLSFTSLKRLKFPVKLISCIAYGSASTACCLLKYVLSIYSIYWNNSNLIDN